MLKNSLVLSSLVIVLVASGCASHIKVTQKPSPNASIGLVKLTDCAQIGSNDCDGSGTKISKIYSEVLNVPIVDESKSKDFDVIITGTVTDYNEAVPMAFRPNFAGVNIVAKDKKGSVMVAQHDGDSANNITGSSVRIARGLAESFKEALGR
jgi:hypothetical protein